MARPPLRPVGCSDCDHQGYRGRIALTEVLRFDAELDALVARRAPAHDLLAAVERRGFVTLAQDAMRRVADGSTTIEEIARVVDLTGFPPGPSDPIAEEAHRQCGQAAAAPEEPPRGGS